MNLYLQIKGYDIYSDDSSSYGGNSPRQNFSDNEDFGHAQSPTRVMPSKKEKALNSLRKQIVAEEDFKKCKELVCKQIKEIGSVYQNFNKNKLCSGDNILFGQFAKCLGTPLIHLD